LTAISLLSNFLRHHRKDEPLGMAYFSCWRFWELNFSTRQYPTSLGLIHVFFWLIVFFACIEAHLHYSRYQITSVKIENVKKES
jgi:hypothetical protein